MFSVSLFFDLAVQGPSDGPAHKAFHQQRPPKDSGPQRSTSDAGKSRAGGVSEASDASACEAAEVGPQA